MPFDPMRPRFSLFVPPNTVRVSAAALQMAREFGEQVRRATPARECVVVFDWAISRAIRRQIGGPREEIGPGLDLVAFDSARVPREAVHRSDGFAFAIKIPREVYEGRPQPVIDVDETEFGKLALRDG